MYDRPFFGSRRGNAPSRLVEIGRRAAGQAILAAGVLLSAACAPRFGAAVRAYEHGRYPEAMEELRTVESEACRWGSSDAARYALYRGLSHLALGDLAATRVWLGRIEHAIAADPALLSEADVERLASARAHLPR